MHGICILPMPCDAHHLQAMPSACDKQRHFLFSNVHRPSRNSRPSKGTRILISQARLVVGL